MAGEVGFEPTISVLETEALDQAKLLPHIWYCPADSNRANWFHRPAPYHPIGLGSIYLVAVGGFEPPMGAYETPALGRLATPPSLEAGEGLEPS